MQEIITAAAELGKRVAAHPRCKAFLDAANAVSADATAQGLLREYQTQLGRIRQREAAGEPIEPADKRAVQSAQERVAGNALLRAMLAAQADYLELVTQVHQAIDRAAHG